MEITAVTINCPACSQPITVPPADETADLEWITDMDALFEVECPCCGWEFSIDEDGEILDGDDVEREPLFAVDEEGELDAEGLIVVKCPYCARVHETDEPGVTRCPGCRRSLQIDGAGRIHDEQGCCCECPCCGSLLESPPGGDLECSNCGGR